MRLFRQVPHLALGEKLAQDQISHLFERSEVLVEVLCPGAASDFYLLDEKEEFDRLMRGFPPDTKAFLTSVSELRNRDRALRIST